MAKSHSFEPAHAQAYGLEEAIIIHHFSWWIEKNRVDGKNLFEGRTWSYNSYAGIAAHFSYLNPRKVRGALDKLVEFGVLMKRPGAKGGMNHYAFTDEAAFTDQKLKPPPDKKGMGVADENDMGDPDKNVNPVPCRKRQGGDENGREGDENGSPLNKGTDDSQLLKPDIREDSTPLAPTKPINPIDAYHEAERLFRGTFLAIVKPFHGNRVPIHLEDKYIGMVADWIASGRTPTEAHFSAAVADAQAYWEKNQREGWCQSISPVETGLTKAMNPPPKRSRSAPSPQTVHAAPIVAVDPEQEAREDAEMDAIEEQMRKVSERWNR